MEFEFISRLWLQIPRQDLTSEDYRRFTEYIGSKCKALDARSNPLQPISSEDMLVVIRELQLHKSSTRAKIVHTLGEKLRAKSPTITAVSKSVDLAATIWLTINIRSTSELLHQDPAVLRWREDQSLSALAAAHFKSTGTKASATVRLGDDLTMANLIAGYGFRIRWTHNLAEHLSFDGAGKIITIYEHKICLRNHLQFKNETALPTAILEEAIDTLNLLFPFGEPSTDSLLRRQGKPFYGLGYCGRQRMLDIDKYSFWRGSIQELQRVMDEPPSGLQQLALARNRRNVLSFATFWMATAVSILTIISLVSGVLSTLYAKRAYDLALLQYELSLAQACTESGAREHLPGFCS
jgi:hypothetical protein